jgi:serine/threonine protein phosphatase 1
MHKLYAIGDIHGCFEPLKLLVENKMQPEKQDKIIILGDFIDRGPQSKDVVDYLIQLRSSGFDVTLLKGNHEAMLLDAIKGEDSLHRWLYYGGEATLKSFGVKHPSELNAFYLDFFATLPSHCEIGKYLFVHAGFNDALANPFDDTHAMLWESQTRYSNPILASKTVVHGHRPLPLDACIKQILQKNLVINIDTGCCYSDKTGFGKLTALEVFSKTILSI